MHIFSRETGQSIMIGEDIEITIMNVGTLRGRVKVAINTDKKIPVHRKEVYQRIKNGDAA